jgi:hypothetical protein
MESRSLFLEAKHHAEQHKWIRSEQAGCDLGRSAIEEWKHQYWPGFCRARLVEHILGLRCWAELDRDDFGVWARLTPTHPGLLNGILEQLRQNKENLNIIWWANRHGHPMDQVVQILEVVDINGRRLPPEWD